MAVAALSKYEFAAKDSVDKFPAPLLFIGWEDHKMFCAPFAVPLPPTMKFADMCRSANTACSWPTKTDCSPAARRGRSENRRHPGINSPPLAQRIDDFTRSLVASRRSRG